MNRREFLQALFLTGASITLPLAHEANVHNEFQEGDIIDSLKFVNNDQLIAKVDYYLTGIGGAIRRIPVYTLGVNYGSKYI